LAASSIYSSASSGLSSLMPRLRVPEPDLSDPTECLHSVSNLIHERWNDSGRQRAPHVVLDGSRDMWQGEFAPGPGRIQLPDVDEEPGGGNVEARIVSKQLVFAAGVNDAWRYHNSTPADAHALQRNGVDERFAEQRSGQAVPFAPSNTVDSTWPRSNAHARHARAPGSYVNSPNASSSQRALHFDGNAVTSVAPLAIGSVGGHEGGGSVAAAASLRLADPDVVLSSTVAHACVTDVAVQQQPVRETVPLWSQHQASPIVDILHQYLQQQHEVSAA
jgi:hypothetical protein